MKWHISLYKMLKPKRYFIPSTAVNQGLGGKL